MRIAIYTLINVFFISLLIQCYYSYRSMRSRIEYNPLKLSSNFESTYSEIQKDHPFLPLTTELTLSNIDLAGINIANIRLCSDKLKVLVKTNKNDKRCKKILEMVDKLKDEEKRRPIREQFPIVSFDVEKLVQACEKLEKSTENLLGNSRNKADQLENIISDAIEKYLQENTFVNIENFSKQNRILYDRKRNKLVEWDAIFIATSKDGVTYLILVEVKEIPHKNDIIYDINMSEDKQAKTLLSRATRTLDLSKEIQNVDLKTTNKLYQSQAFLFQDISKIIVVFASANLRDDLIKEVEMLNEKVPSNDVTSLEFRYADIDFPLNFDF